MAVPGILSGPGLSLRWRSVVSVHQQARRTEQQPRSYRVARSGEEPHGRTRLRMRAADATVWYLRLVALLNVLAVVSVSFREEVREHTLGEYFTPYLVTAGLVSSALAGFLAVVMRRRKRAAWIFNMLLAGALF